MTARYQVCPFTGVRFRVRTQSDWQPLASAATLSFEISINNPFCDGRYLESQLHWAQGYPFNGLVFSVGDSLNTYTYAVLGHPILGLLPIHQAEAVATSEGTDWITRNAPLIEDILGSATVIRWNHWRATPGFDIALALYTTAYEQDQTFRSCVHEELVAFAGRRGHEPPAGKQMDILALHILEELAVYRLQCRQGPTVILYPGSMSRLYKALHDNTQTPLGLPSLEYRYVELR
jgi:hypothetical protein